LKLELADGNEGIWFEIKSLRSQENGISFWTRRLLVAHGSSGQSCDKGGGGGGGKAEFTSGWS